MGVIQQSVNSVIGATTQAVGIGKGIKELKKKNELELANAKSDIIEGIENVKKSEIEMINEETRSKNALKEAKSELSSIEQKRDWDNSPQLLKKREEAARNVAEQKEAITLQKKDFAARRQALQTQLDSAVAKADAYGINIIELMKGGKK